MDHDLPEISFRARFVSGVTISGFVYILILWFLPYSVVANAIMAIIAFVFAGAYYLLSHTKPTLEHENASSWLFSMWCWVGMAVLQILPIVGGGA